MQKFILPILLLLLVSCTPKETTTPPKTSKVIIAYVYGWEDNWTEETANQVTHINYAFANIGDGRVMEGKPSDSLNMANVNALKKWNPELKTLISVGGWSWSKGFSDAVLTDSSREIFAESAVDFMLTHKLDGVDLDWEYPGQIGDNNPFRPEDKENFTEILKLIRQKLDEVGKGKIHYLLTIATGANQSYLDHTNMAEAQKYLDFINIMTYDYRVGGSSETGHHANLFVSEADTGERKRSSNLAVTEHVNAGIPIEKLVLGVPFYGKGWSGVDSADNGRYKTYSGKARGYRYSLLVDSFINKQGFVRHWDEAAQTPYLWNPDSRTFITYEDPESFRIRNQYIKDKGMSGVMFWQYNGDNEAHDLLGTLAEGLK